VTFLPNSCRGRKLNLQTPPVTPRAKDRGGGENQKQKEEGKKPFPLVNLKLVGRTGTCLQEKVTFGLEPGGGARYKKEKGGMGNEESLYWVLYQNIAVSVPIESTKVERQGKTAGDKSKEKPAHQKK